MNPVFVIAGMVIKEIFRKKDFYVALILVVAILFYASQLNFYNTGKIVRYLEELGLMLIFLFSVILTVTLAARQYPVEIQSRTAYVLLAKPINRFQFIAGKFLGSLFAGWAAFIIFYVLFLGIVCVKSGSLVSPVIAGQTGYLFLLCLMTVTAMTSAFSYFLTISANVTLSMVLYVLINSYGAVLKKASQHLFWLSRWIGEVFYYLLPHFEFFDLRQRFIHEWPPLSGGLLVFLTAYAFIFTGLFLVLGWLILRKRAI